MFGEHNVLGIEIGGYLKAYAEGRLAICVMLIIVLVVATWLSELSSDTRSTAP